MPLPYFSYPFFSILFPRYKWFVLWYHFVWNYILSTFVWTLGLIVVPNTFVSENWGKHNNSRCKAILCFYLFIRYNLFVGYEVLLQLQSGRPSLVKKKDFADHKKILYTFSAHKINNENVFSKGPFQYDVIMLRWVGSLRMLISWWQWWQVGGWWWLTVFLMTNDD